MDLCDELEWGAVELSAQRLLEISSVGLGDKLIRSRFPDAEKLLSIDPNREWLWMGFGMPLFRSMVVAG